MLLSDFISAEAAIKQGEEVVLLSSPQAFNVRLTDGRTIRVAEGVQNAPRAVANDWYAKAHGVTVHEAPKPPVAVVEAAPARPRGRPARPENANAVNPE
jgi:hypothetical protein